jgi:hypothetical protein
MILRLHLSIQPTLTVFRCHLKDCGFVSEGSIRRWCTILRPIQEDNAVLREMPKAFRTKPPDPLLY